MNNKLMTHVVAGYPTKAQCIELLLGMQEAGVSIIEVQIPFSDPSADGPVIMKANDTALENGTTIQDCFDMLAQARTQGLKVPLYIMSYANKVMSFGIEGFCSQAQKIGVNGLIIPDLPCGTSDHEALLGVCSARNLDLVPVASPGTLVSRLSEYKLETHELIYVTSTQGITGKELTIKQELLDLIEIIRSKTNGQIALGFGIRNLPDVQQALEVADFAVIGSAVIKIMEDNDVKQAVQFIERLVNNQGEKHD
jgi:tryptophan synthase alpha chain